MKISLPDVNILLALVGEGHSHHVSALRWFDLQESDSIAVCRVTQMGLLRLLTNPKVMSAGTCTIESAWNISNEILSDKRVFFEYEPAGVESAWASLMRNPGAGSRSWTDAYLAAFAQRHDYEVVTFDRDFRRWKELRLTLLV